MFPALRAGPHQVLPYARTMLRFLAFTANCPPKHRSCSTVMATITQKATWTPWFSETNALAYRALFAVLRNVKYA